jgi:hypothetical protein
MVALTLDGAQLFNTAIGVGGDEPLAEFVFAHPDTSDF